MWFSILVSRTKATKFCLPKKVVISMKFTVKLLSFKYNISLILCLLNITKIIKTIFQHNFNKQKIINYVQCLFIYLNKE